MSRGKSRSMSGTATSSSFRKRPIERFASTGKLEHLPVEQEETGEAQTPDQSQLFIEPLPCRRVTTRVSIRERVVANGTKLCVGRIRAAGEVRVVVAELLCQVERAAVCDLSGACGGRARQPLEHLCGSAEDGFLVPATFALGAVEVRPVADRNEHVLQAGA